jgi:DNA mismatch endonuclease, patch repair protein
MADVHNLVTRSYNMSRIKGIDTKPEMLVRKFLYARGLRYRLHNKNLPGKPDLTLPKYNTVIFVNGCFWHGHKGCKYFVLPKTRTEWWKQKIEKTMERDRIAVSSLNTLGWITITIWECELKTKKITSTLTKLLNSIKSEQE